MPETSFAAGHALLPSRGLIQFERVSFRYRGDETVVLQDISFKLRPRRSNRNRRTFGVGQEHGRQAYPTSLRARRRPRAYRRHRPQHGRPGLAAPPDRRCSAGKRALNRSIRDNLLSPIPTLSFDGIVDAAQLAGVQEVIKAECVANLKQLVSPVDGVSAATCDPHGRVVVTPAQPLAVVVPAESGLEIEALVSNRDIGFVVPGQEARIKVDTFNFTRCGLLHGRIVSISRDSHRRWRCPPRLRATGRQQASPSKRSRRNSAIPPASLDETQLPVDGKLVDLAAAITATVEIKTGSRRIISYLQSSIARYMQEVLRER
jgi:hypothetical protein